jgi:SAM-dependent methyltransferase
MGKNTPDGGHYTCDAVGDLFGMPGAGLHAYFTRDLLHPPMVADAAMWADGGRWWHGSAQHTLHIGALAELRPGDTVLDVGGGVGGPARLLADHYAVAVTSVTNSEVHAQTSRRLNQARPVGQGSVRVVVADCQRSLPDGPFDAAVSINMLYQVSDHRAMFGQVLDRLAAGGRFVLDDWMLTPLATAADVGELARHFEFPHFARTNEVEADLMTVGFPPAETTQDLGHVGRGPMVEHFERQMQTYFAPIVIADWPGDPAALPGRPAYGQMMLDEFTAAVNLTLALYRSNRMTYRRLLVRKLG